MDYRLKNGTGPYHLDDDRMPDWTNDLAEAVKQQHGVYDQFVKKHLRKALKHIHKTIKKHGEAKIPPPTPLELAEGRLKEWFRCAPKKRLAYMDKGRDEYFDRLSLQDDDEYFVSQQVGAKIEFQELVKRAHEQLRNRGLIEEMKEALGIDGAKAGAQQ